MKNAIHKIPSTFLGVIFIVFGLNKFFGFIPVEPPVEQTAQIFMGAMFSSYLFAIVALLEIAGGIMLIVPKTRFLAWMILLPVMLNIALFHFAHDFIGNGIWLLPLILMTIIGYQEKEKINSLIKITL